MKQILRITALTIFFLFAESNAVLVASELSEEKQSSRMTALLITIRANEFCEPQLTKSQLANIKKYSRIWFSPTNMDLFISRLTDEKYQKKLADMIIGDKKNLCKYYNDTLKTFE